MTRAFITIGLCCATVVVASAMEGRAADSVPLQSKGNAAPQTDSTGERLALGLNGRLIVVKPKIAPTEWFQVNLELRNNDYGGGSPLAVQTGNPFLFEARVTDASGKSVPPTMQRTEVISRPEWLLIRPIPAERPTVPLSIQSTDGAKGSHLDTTTRIWKLPPGKYKISGTFSAPREISYKGKHGEPWTGQLELAPVEVEIAAEAAGARPDTPTDDKHSVSIRADFMEAVRKILPKEWSVERSVWSGSSGCTIVLRDKSRPSSPGVHEGNALLCILPSEKGEQPGTVEGRGKSYAPILNAVNGTVYLWADTGDWKTIDADLAKAVTGEPMKVPPFVVEFVDTQGTKQRATIRANWLQLCRFGTTVERFESACRLVLGRQPVADLRKVCVTMSGHRDMWLGAVAEIAIAGPTPEVIQHYVDRIRSILPKGWSLQADRSELKIVREEPVEWYNPTSLPAHRDLAELKAMGFVQTGKYEIVLTFETPWSAEKLAKVQQQNGHTTAEIAQLAEKMVPFLEPRSKPLSTTGQYRPKTDQDWALMNQYNRLRAAIVRLPDLHTANASIFLSDSLGGPIPKFYSDTVAAECKQVCQAVKAVLASHEAVASGTPSTPWSEPTAHGLQTRLVLLVAPTAGAVIPGQVEVRHKDGKDWAQNATVGRYEGTIVVTSSDGKELARHVHALDFNTSIPGGKPRILCRFDLHEKPYNLDKPGKYAVQFAGFQAGDLATKGMVDLPPTPKLEFEIAQASETFVPPAAPPQAKPFSFVLPDGRTAAIKPKPGAFGNLVSIDSFQKQATEAVKKAIAKDPRAKIENVVFMVITGSRGTGQRDIWLEQKIGDFASVEIVEKPNPGENEAREIQRIRQGLEDRSIPEPPAWTLIHMAADKEKAEALEALGVEKEKDSWDLPVAVRKAGGLQKYKERIAALLHSNDATVRGFAVVWLADLGDPAYVKDILTLLRAENLPDAGGVNRNWDRGQAAFALGILGTREHTKVLVGFLDHHDKHVRAGAVAGLARLKAKERDKEIAVLLKDEDPRVVCAAIAALAELDAKQYSDRIGALLEATDVEIPKMALMALVMLDAKEQAPRVANLLKDRFNAGQAAKTLALLRAEKYTQDIAKLLNVEDSLARADALVALGILGASRYAPQVARHMQDKQDFVRHAAAWSIVMMEAEAYTTEAITIQRAVQKDKVNPMGSADRGIPRDRLRQLEERFAKCLARLSENPTAQESKEAGGKSNGSPKERALDLGGGVKLELVLIPAGEFKIGSPDSDKLAFDAEKPQHRVRITKPFYLGKYLVTQEQWEAVMGGTPSHFKGPKNPVEQVSWDDCQNFLEKLNAKVSTEHGKFVLPTEAQWEYGCRAGSTTRYCFGDDESGLGQYAWYSANSDTRTHPVGKRKPNAWGLYDMHGNVWEWCQDWYDRGYYAKSPTDDPMGAATGSNRVARGGSWYYQAWSCRSASRGSSEPGSRRYFQGLRVSLVPADK